MGLTPDTPATLPCPADTASFNMAAAMVLILVNSLGGGRIDFDTGIAPRKSALYVSVRTMNCVCGNRKPSHLLSQWLCAANGTNWTAAEMMARATFVFSTGNDTWIGTEGTMLPMRSQVTIRSMD